MMNRDLFQVVADIAHCLNGWRCDQRGETPKLMGPKGARVSIRRDKGDMIEFHACPPNNHDGRYRSWQSWGINRREWQSQTIKCSARRPASHIANDLKRRLLADVERFWPMALERRQSEQTEIEILRHVTGLFLRIVPGAKVITWNSSDTCQNIGFDGGQCEVTTYQASASLKLYDLSYDDALKIAAFYQQMKNDKAGENGQGQKAN